MYQAQDPEDEEAQKAQQQATNAAFQQYINTPAGMAEYTNRVNQRWDDIQNQTNGYEHTADGGFLDSLGSIADPIMNAVIQYGPAVYGAAVGADALGLLGGGASTAASGAGAAEAGAGLGSIGSGVGAGTTATEAGAGLGSMIGLEGGAPAVVSVGAPAAATGGGLGSILAGTGAVGAGVGLGLGGTPTPQPTPQPQPTPDIPDAGSVTVTAPTPPAPTDLGSILGAGAAAGGIGSVLSNPGTIPQSPDLSNVYNDVPDPNIPDAGTVVIPPPASTGASGTLTPPAPIDYTPSPSPVPVVVPPLTNVTPGTGGSGTPTGIPSWTDILGGLGSILGGLNDYHKNTEDQGYWQNYMDQLTGMYKPGTPEANLMQQQMDAKDAAAGRNSQYGVRAQNLGAMLADQRAKIMTSPTFYAMGAASRGHYDNSLNSIFNLAGQGSQGGLGGLGSLFNAGTSYLSNLFSGRGNTSAPANNGTIPNVLF